MTENALKECQITVDFYHYQPFLFLFLAWISYYLYKADFP